jgi:hypothetical protein
VTVVKPGGRFRCAECGTEVVIIRGDGSFPHCCNRAMESLPQGAAMR